MAFNRKVNLYMTCCNIFEVFDEKNNLIKDYEHWKILARNRNTTLGNCVAITKRHMERFSDVAPQEMQEFAQVVKDIEGALQRSFAYDKINYLMLMMKDNHVHFHIIPRYATPRNFAGIQWTDDDWPKSSHLVKAEVPQEILQQIKQEIIKNL